MTSQDHQAPMVKGKPMFDGDQKGTSHQFRRQMDNSSHTATVRGLKQKRSAQARYLGQDNKRYSKGAIEHALKG